MTASSSRNVSNGRTVGLSAPASIAPGVLPNAAPKVVPLQHLSANYFAAQLSALKFGKDANTGSVNIPVFNIARYRGATPEKKQEMATVFSKAFNEYGFVAVTGHGLPLAKIEEYYAKVRKALLDQSTRDAFYEPVSNVRGIYQKEMRITHHAGRHHNLYSVQAKDFAKVNYELLQHLQSVGNDIVSMIGLYLGDSNQFLRGFAGIGRKNENLLRALYYPSKDELKNLHQEPVETLIARNIRSGKDYIERIPIHTDYSLVTLLLPPTTSGLQILKKEAVERLRNQGFIVNQQHDYSQIQEDDWLDVTYPIDAIIVNGGDFLEIATNGYAASEPTKFFTAGPHRVISDKALKEGRTTTVYFYDGDPTKPLPDLKQSIATGNLVVAKQKYFEELAETPLDPASRHLYKLQYQKINQFTNKPKDPADFETFLKRRNVGATIQTAVAEGSIPATAYHRGAPDFTQN